MRPPNPDYVMAPVSGLRLAPGMRFDATDADLVLGYLLPRLRGRALPVDGLVVDADPYAAAPPVLMALHARRRDDAFFFLPAKIPPSRSAGPGGWRMQRSDAGAAVSEDGEAVAWRKKVLVYYYPDGDGASGGWVMHRFDVSGEGEGQDLVLCRVKKGGRLKKPKKSQELDAPPSRAVLGAPTEQRRTDAAADENAVGVHGLGAVLVASHGGRASPALASGIAPLPSVPLMTG